MPSWSARIHPALRPYVRAMTGYDYRLAPNAIHHGLPSTDMTMIIAFDEPLDCGWFGGAGRAGFDVLLSGLHTRPAVIHTHGHQHGIQLALSPQGSRTLFGCPAGELAGHLVPGDAIGIPVELHARLQESPWADRFRVLERHLLGRLDRRVPAMHADVCRAWRRVGESNGQVRVSDLAAEVGLSRRQLLTVMRRELGVTPVQAIRLARFANAKGQISLGFALSRVAHECGYADQSHLSREFRALAGLTPTQLFENFPIVQDQA